MGIGKKRAKRAWALAAAAALAVAASLSLIWFVPAREDPEPAGAAARGEDTARESGGGDAVNGGNGAGGGEGEARPTPETAPGEAEQGAALSGGESTPPVVVKFPDPIGVEPESPPPQGYDDVTGRWVAEMSGASYGLSNCHFCLEEDGSISVPELYESVFVIQQGSYTWKKGDPSFSAVMQVLVRLGSSQARVLVELELTGTVSDSLTEIAGGFTAVPVGQAYAVYAQQGAFVMRR